MKVMQILPALEQGGVERGVVEMNRVILGAGWENIVVSAGGRMTEQIVQDGGRVLTMDVKSKNPLTFFRRARALRGVLASERPDVVCVHSRVPAWLYKWANRGLGIPWISFAHGANSIGWYSRVMTAGDRIVVPSQFVADYLAAAYRFDRAKMRVIPRAIETARFDPSRLDGDFIVARRVEWKTAGFRIVMGLGRITQLKGYDILIEAMRFLPADVKLVIVGEAEELRRAYADELWGKVASFKLQDRVVFAGNQSKVAECLSMADVVVSANWRKPEAFGRSMAEALAMNRPVVATAFGGALEIVEDGVNGSLVPVTAKDASAEDRARLYASAIQRALALPRSDWRSDVLEKFSFEKMAERSLAVYRELAAKKHSMGE